MGNRTVALGHAFPTVVDAAMRELSRGSNFTRPSPIEVACADQFLALIGGAEMVKFSKDGSDVTSGAVKLARAYTGRELVALLCRPSVLLGRRLVHRHHADECRHPRQATSS